MIIGIPKEIKAHEYRVALLPAGANELTTRGHQVLIEQDAGRAVGFENGEYVAAGATIVESANQVFERAHMIVKVKEPQPEEWIKLAPEQLLFTYLHLASDPEQATGLLRSGCVAVAYETITDRNGRLPLLAPMSEVAGRMAVLVAAEHLAKRNKGSGVLLGGVPGVAPARVLIIGGGVAGAQAARMALGLEADVTIVEASLTRLRELADLFHGRARTIYPARSTIASLVAESDVVIGTVLIPGDAAPKLVTRAMIARMRPGSVVVDVSIDQGGCFETSRPTTHNAPTFVEEGVVHYCVTNMPGAYPRTSAFALANATFPFVAELADKGWRRALSDDSHLRQGLNICMGRVTHAAVARSLGLDFIEPAALLGKLTGGSAAVESYGLLA